MMTKPKTIICMLLVSVVAMALLFALPGASVDVDGEPDQISGASVTAGNLTASYDGTYVHVIISPYAGAPVDISIKDNSTLAFVAGYGPATLSISGTTGSISIQTSLTYNTSGYTVSYTGYGGGAVILDVTAAYWIKYVDADGAPLPGSGYVGHGQIPPYSPTRASSASTDYTFAGWVEGMPVAAAPGGATYHAKPWIETTRAYVITINTNGGTIASPGIWTGGPNTYTSSINYGSPIALPAIERTGYTLDPTSWPTSPAPTVSNAATFAPVWIPIPQLISLDPAGGTLSAGGWTYDGVQYYTKPINYGTALGALPTPSRSGYTFSGWAAPAATALVTAPATYTASWTVISGGGGGGSPTTYYTVSLDLDGGAVSDGTWVPSGTVSGKTFASGTSLALPTPVRAGYAFNGWSPAPSATVTGNATYTAQWTVAAVITVHVTVGLNGTTARADVTANAGDDVEVLVSPASGYVIDKVTTKWDYKIDGNKITLKSVDSDSTVEVTFKEEPSSDFPWWIVMAAFLVILLLIFIIWRYKTRDKNAA